MSSEVIEFQRSKKSFWLMKGIRNMSWLSVPALMYYWYTLKTDVFSTSSQIDEAGWAILIMPCIALYCSWFLWGWKHRHFRISKNSVEMEDSWISCDIETVPINRIRQVKFEQGAIGRWLSYGTIKVDSIGSDSPEIYLLHVDDPREIKKKIEERMS